MLCGWAPVFPRSHAGKVREQSCKQPKDCHPEVLFVQQPHESMCPVEALEPFFHFRRIGIQNIREDARVELLSLYRRGAQHSQISAIEQIHTPLDHAAD
jgi:hypothetical protein